MNTSSTADATPTSRRRTDRQIDLASQKALHQAPQASMCRNQAAELLPDGSRNNRFQEELCSLDDTVGLRAYPPQRLITLQEAGLASAERTSRDV